MLKLYRYPSGAQDIRLLSKIPEVAWAHSKRTVVDLLREKSYDDMADFFEASPFELCEATNDFNDDFNVLYVSVSAKQYVTFQSELRDHRGKYDVLAQTLEDAGIYVRFIVAEVRAPGEIEAVPVPTLAISSAAVERALADCQMLIRSQGAISCLDRVHTAFHGYLISVCRKADILPPGEPDVTALFKALRTRHPAIKEAVDRSTYVDTIIKQMATIVNSLNPLRNSNSMAHPNEELLDEPEAMLVINSVRTLLHYLNNRVE